MELHYSKSFDTKKGKYLYDSMMNLLYEIDDKFFDIINSSNIGLEDNDYYNNYIKEHGIRDVTIPAEVKISHNYNQQFIKNTIDNHRTLLILSVTNRCNLNCTYCCYHDKFLENSNTNHTMTFETAVKAIDKMIEKSLNLEKIHVGFYGGEGLLEFDFIKKCVDYVISKSVGVVATFGITTNGLLLEHEEIRRYFEKYDFQIGISLDGPKFINDRYRLKETGDGSYDEIIKNIKLWYSENPEYALEKISLNAVEAPPFHKEALDDFFSNFPINYRCGSMDMTPFFADNIDNNKNEYVDKVLNRSGVVYSDIYNDVFIQSFVDYMPQDSTMIPSMIIPGGTCVPIFMRWYVNSKGDYYPCERVPEIDEFCIGNVDTDVNFGKVVTLFDNYINAAKTKCNSCWASRLCGRCFKNINEDCEQLLEAIEKRYIYYIENIKDNKKAMELLQSIIISI